MCMFSGCVDLWLFPEWRTAMLPAFQETVIGDQEVFVKDRIFSKKETSAFEKLLDKKVLQGSESQSPKYLTP